MNARMPELLTICCRLICALVLCLVALPAWAQTRAQPGPFQDCSDCPVMIPIPAGTFIMGVPPEEEEREKVPPRLRGRSTPQHKVSIRESFAIGKYPVTRAEFSAFIRDTAYPMGNICWFGGVNSHTHTTEWKKRVGYNWRNPSYPQTDTEPVVCVSWDDAKAYVDWLTRKTRRPYRLPTEAEWEYAARAGSVTARFWGDDPSLACRYADVADISKLKFFGGTPDREIEGGSIFNCSQPFSRTAPVGSYQPNAFGLYDMLGNVWQWVEDCWTPNYEGAPDDGSARTDGDCRRRMLRGGSWINPPSEVRSGLRTNQGSIDRTVIHGFRVAGPVDNLISSNPRPNGLVARDNQSSTTETSGAVVRTHNANAEGIAAQRFEKRLAKGDLTSP